MLGADEKSVRHLVPGVVETQALAHLNHGRFQAIRLAAELQFGDTKAAQRAVIEIKGQCEAL